MTQFKMSKAARTAIDKALAEAQAKRTEAADAVEAFNATLTEAREKLDEAVEAYRAARAELAAAIEAERDAFQSTYDDKSERWQEGETATAAAEFIEQLTTAVDELQSEIDLDMPEDVEPDLGNPEETLADMPREVEDDA